MIYCSCFELRPIIKASGISVKVISGTRKSIGSAMIQIPFPAVCIIIDVEFLIMSGNVPTLQSMRDMLVNNLEVSILGRTIRCGDMSQPLGMENYFLIHTWSLDDLRYVLYTETQLNKIHKTFGHPIIRASRSLFTLAIGE